MVISNLRVKNVFTRLGLLRYWSHSFLRFSVFYIRQYMMSIGYHTSSLYLKYYRLPPTTHTGHTVAKSKVGLSIYNYLWHWYSIYRCCIHATGPGMLMQWSNVHKLYVCEKRKCIRQHVWRGFKFVNAANLRGHITGIFYLVCCYKGYFTSNLTMSMALTLSMNIPQCCAVTQLQNTFNVTKLLQFNVRLRF